MIQPEELKQDTALIWSTGNGTDVWEIFCAAGKGDINTVKALLEKDASLVRCAYEYHTPMFFAVCSNQLEVAAYLLEKGASPVVSGTSDNLLQIAKDRDYHEMAQLIEKSIGGALCHDAVCRYLLLSQYTRILCPMVHIFSHIFKKCTYLPAASLFSFNFRFTIAAANLFSNAGVTISAFS